jgi:ELWxxDGT repeat protein
VVVKEIGPGAFGVEVNNLTVVNGTLFFTAIDPVAGNELWATDGTEAATVVVADIRGGPGGSSPFSLAAVGDTLLFAADDGVSGFELWKTTLFASPVPRLYVTLDQATYGPGDTMILTVTLAPGLVAPGPVDAFVLLPLPDGTVLSLRPDGTLAPGILPIATGFVPVAFAGEAARFVIPSVTAPVALSWKAALVDAGTATLIGGIDDGPFVVTP